MDWLPLIALGVTAFVATNLDDSLLLLFFFGDRRYRARHVFAGQALGISLLVLISLIGAMLALALPARLSGLLGLIPIGLGLKQLHEQRRGAPDDEPFPGQQALSPGAGWRRAATVAGVTLANGGDNIGVYIPLFATRPPAQTGLILAVFAAMLVIWFLGGYYLARRSVVAGLLQQLSQRFLPYALIALGSAILIESVLSH